MSTQAPGGISGRQLLRGGVPLQRRVQPIFKPVKSFPGRALPLEGAPSPSSIVALIMSITGLLFLVPAIGGVVLGSIELSRIKKGDSPARGRSLALAGIIIGAAVLALDIIATVIILAKGS